jgi:hypothetical protein
VNAAFKAANISLQKYHTLEFSNEKERRFFPDQPSLSRCLTQLSLSNCVQTFWNEVLFAHLILLMKNRIIKKELKLIADYHEEPCKKDKTDLYCFGTKKGKTVHKTLTFSIISNGLHQVIANYKIKKRDHKLPFFQDIMDRLKSQGFLIIYALLDRGFYRKEILQAFRQWKITLIMPGRKCAQTQQKILNYLSRKGNRWCKGFLKLDYVRKIGYPTLVFDLLLVAKKSYRLSSIFRDLDSQKLTISDAAKRIFPLIVSLSSSRGISTLHGNESYIRDLYRERWLIEIAFRDMNRFGISKHIQGRDARLSITGAKSLLYNIWQVQRFLLQKDDLAAEPLELNEFLGKTQNHRYIQYIPLRN